MPEETEDLTAQFNALLAAEEGAAQPEAAPTPAPKPAAAPAAAPPKEPHVEGKVAPTERVLWRQEKARDREKLAAERAKFEEERQAFEAIRGKHIAPESAASMLAEGKFDEVAEKLGFKSWEDMNSAAARALSSPEYRHSRAQEAKLKEIEAKLAEKEKAEKEAQTKAERDAENNRYKTQLGTFLKSSKVPEIGKLSESPDFVDIVFAEGLKHFERYAEPADPEEIAKTVAEGLRSTYNTLREVFEPPAARTANSEARKGSQAGQGTASEKPRKTPMSSQASEASAQLDPENDQDWYKLAQQEMLAAGRADREEESRRRRA